MQHGLAAVLGNPGRYGWNGTNGTDFFYAHKEESVVAYGNAALRDPGRYHREQVQALVYGALSR